VEDLSKWVIHFQQALKSGDPVYERMIVSGKRSDGEAVDYGYGLEITERAGIKIISHNGDWMGYHSIIVNYPDRDISFIILSNLNTFDIMQYSDAVSGFYFGDSLKSELRSEDLSNIPTVKVDPKILEKYRGSFQLGKGWYVTFTIENGQLMVQASGEPKFGTEAKSDTVFWVPQYHAYFTFPATQAAQVNAVKYRYQHILAPRVTLLQDMPDLQQYVGSYYSEEFETSYSVSVDNGKLTLHHMRLGDIGAAPDPVTKDLFESGIGKIQFYRDGSGRIIGYRVSGGRVQNIEFQRE
jgi:hypothetical protein